MSVRRLLAGALASLALAALLARPIDAQERRPRLHLPGPDGEAVGVGLDMDRGYAAFPVTALETLGWTVEGRDARTALTLPDGRVVRLRDGSAYFAWGDTLLQLMAPPYRADDGTLRVPLQLLSDFLVRRRPRRYAFDGATLTLRDLRAPSAARSREPATGSPVPPDTAARADIAPDRTAGEAVVRGAPVAGDSAARGDSSRAVDAAVAGDSAAGGEAPVRARPPAVAGPRVVIIDAGHGGGDPGAIGRGGLREKDVALGIARDLARDLEGDPRLEVHMIRSGDTFVPLWDRGEMATKWKGERPGVFISIHANSFPRRRDTRGFETYFLSEARTDHERRVAAIENAPLHVESSGSGEVKDSDLGFILRELRNLDDQHWSALLAQMVQEELGSFHPGPNRGVKQGVLAVLTNAVMPAVLVEVGYLSNSKEAPLLGDPAFQKKAADALAQAVRRFFRRYPPGAGGTGGR